MIDILVAVCIWYGLGAIAAAWATHKGHAADMWVIGAALWGAIMVPLVMAARLAVLAHPARLDLPARWLNLGGMHVLLIVHVDDSPREALAPLDGLAQRINVLDIVILVSEEARSGLIPTADMAKAEIFMHRILRATPPARTSASITSLSALVQLARRGWRADLVVVTPQVLDRPFATSVGRTIAQLDRSSREPLRPRSTPRPPRRVRPRHVARDKATVLTEKVHAL